MLKSSLTRSGSHLLTTDHDLHRRRRKPLEPFFSRLGISKLQPMLAEVAEKLETRLRNLAPGTVIRLDHALSAFSGDIIGRICWESQEEFLDHEDFNPDWYDVIHTIIRSLPLFTAFPEIVRVVSFVPENILLWAFPKGRGFNKFKEVALKRVTEAKRDQGKQIGEKDAKQFSLFHHIVNSDMPESERSDERLAREAQVLLGGGTASTARTLGFASYYVMASPDLRKRLQEELQEPMIDWPKGVPSWADLEKLPLLQALIKESLRYGTPKSCLVQADRMWPD